MQAQAQASNKAQALDGYRRLAETWRAQAQPKPISVAWPKPTNPLPPIRIAKIDDELLRTVANMQAQAQASNKAQALDGYRRLAETWRTQAQFNKPIGAAWPKITRPFAQVCTPNLNGELRQAVINMQAQAQAANKPQALDGYRRLAETWRTPIDLNRAVSGKADSVTVPADRTTPLRIVPDPDEIVVELVVRAQVWLDETCPESHVEMIEAQDRLRVAQGYEGSRQATVIAHAMESCRRALNFLANSLSPPESKGTRVDPYGREYRTDEHAFVNRLHIATIDLSSKRRRRLEQTELQLLHCRLASLIGHLSKGVHSSISLAEAKQLYVDTWRVIGSIRTYA
jgi:hypothetical protein